MFLFFKLCIAMRTKACLIVSESIGTFCNCFQVPSALPSHLLGLMYISFCFFVLRVMKCVSCLNELMH